MDRQKAGSYVDRIIFFLLVINLSTFSLLVIGNLQEFTASSQSLLLTVLRTVSYLGIVGALLRCLMLVRFPARPKRLFLALATGVWSALVFYLVAIIGAFTRVVI